MTSCDEWIAKSQIAEVLYRYCRALDRMDRPMAESLWHPDAMVDYGPLYRGDAQGLIDIIWEVHNGVDAHSHQISNILTEIAGDTAVSESYVTAALRFRNETGATMQLTARARYLDRWQAIDGSWRILERKVVHDFSDIAQVTDSETPKEGRRDASDPSWALFRDA